MKTNCVLISIFCVSIATGQVTSFAEGKPVPRFEPAPIPDEIAPKSGQVEFGYLVVYEDRNDPHGGTIRLPVMIGKSRSENPCPDPTIFTVGGPGVISTMRGGRDLDDWPHLDDRDFIYFEQRGAQYAEPNLTGPEIDSLILSSSSRVNGQPDRADLVAVARQLKQRLTAEGIDLTCYSTRESAADIEDLRLVLGIDQWNLYGISYSCRLMLEVMRRYPEGVRAAILDSPLPPDVSWDETSIERYWLNFAKLAEASEADSLLREKYPNLQARFLEFIRAANIEPIPVDVKHPVTGDSVTVTVDGQGLFLLMAGFMASGSYIYSFPYSVDLICNRNPEILSYLSAWLVSLPQYAWGMRYSIWCNEVLPFEDFAKFGHHGGLPEPLTRFAWTIVEPEIFEVWPRRPADPTDRLPVVSEIPVLVTNGQYDPDTTPEWGRRVCRTLPHSHYFEFPGQSHLPLFNHPCGRQMAIEFLNHPFERPSDSCLTSYGPFRFYSGD